MQGNGLAPGEDPMSKYEYEHVFVQHMTDGQSESAIPLGVKEGLNAWGADGWEVVHMEAVWAWHQQTDGKSWPETLRGYYVTFKREAGASGGPAVAAAIAEVGEIIASGTPTE
jgi:hypothetical protein